MNIKQMFANAIVRRVVFVVVAALAGFVVSIFDAKADATCYTNSTGGLCSNESEAYINAKRAATYACTSQSTGQPIGTVTYNTTNYTSAYVRFNCTTYQPFPYTRSFPASQRCPVDEPIDPATGQCTTPNTCSTKPPLTNVSYGGQSGVCSGGCEFAVDVTAPGATLRVVNAGTPTAKTFAGVMSPTGAECTVGTPVEPFDPNKGVCTATGGSHTECVKPNGDHCVTGAQGTTLCWSPGETGPRSNADGSFSGDRQEAPAMPTAPTNIENPTPVSTSTTTINTTTVNTATFSGTGNTGSQPDTGTGGTDGGEGGEGDDEGDGYGAAAGDIAAARMGGAEGRTVAGVVSAFKSRMAAAPLVTAASGFFTVSAGGGCPTWTLPSTEWSPSIEMNFWCRSELQGAWTMVGVIMLIVFGWAAFRIALL